MTTNSMKVTRSTWVQVSNNEDYMVQNTGKGKVFVKASSSEPTDASASFVLKPEDVITSGMLNGVIWVKAVSDDTLVTYAK